MNSFEVQKVINGKLIKEKQENLTKIKELEEQIDSKNIKDAQEKVELLYQSF